MCFTGQVSKAALFFSQVVSPSCSVLCKWCSVKTNMDESVPRTDWACAWRKQAGQRLLLWAPPVPSEQLPCLPLLSLLTFPAGSTENWHVFGLFHCTEEYLKRQKQINWFVFFILLLVGKTGKKKLRPRYPPADLGSVYLIDLWSFYVWKVVLGRKLLFLKWALSSAENDTLDLAFTKAKIVPGVGGLLVLWGDGVRNPMYLSHTEESFMTWVNLQSCSKWWRVDSINVKTVWVLGLSFLILYITRKRIFSNTALGL